jgi:hypothetical protein
MSVVRGTMPENEDIMTPVEAIEYIRRMGIHLENSFL